MTKLNLSLFVKPSTVLNEAVDEKSKKALEGILLKDSALSSKLKPHEVRQLVDAIIRITDGIAPINQVHTAFAFWVAKQYVAGKININFTKGLLEEIDEEDLHNKLILFYKCRNNRIDIPIKTWAKEEDQWDIKNYDIWDLNTLWVKAHSGEIDTGDRTEDDEEDGSNTEAELARLMAAGTDQSSREYSDALTKVAVAQLVQNAMLRACKKLYDDGTYDVHLIWGAPSLKQEAANGEAGINDIRRGAIAWYKLGSGSGWCVAQGDSPLTNTHGPRYLEHSDVLVFRKNKIPKLSFQYEGSRLIVRDPTDKELFEKSLKEIPMGSFNILGIDGKELKNTNSENRELMRAFFDIYPKLDVSESVTFNNKTFIFTNLSDDNTEDANGKDSFTDIVAKIIQEKIKSLGYSNLKEYVLYIYTTLFIYLYFCGRINKNSKEPFIKLMQQHSTASILLPLVDTTIINMLDVLMQKDVHQRASVDASFLTHLVFKYRDAIEEDILKKRNSDIAFIYLNVLLNDINASSSFSNIPEVGDIISNSKPKEEEQDPHNFLKEWV